MADVTSPFGFPYPEDTDLVRDGASDIENLAEGVNDYLTGGYLYAGTVYFTSSSTFAKADPLGTGDIGLRAIRVRLVGGGGGGGGAFATLASESSSGRGGGGGGYSESFITDIAALNASVTVTRGAGGSGVSGASGNAGNASSFGSGETYEVSANGGDGGAAIGAVTDDRFSAGSSGGLSTAGDLGIKGSDGGGARTQAGRGTMPGSGGASFFGGETAGNSSGSNAVALNGNAASVYGAGGSGAVSRNGAAAATGGTGSNGIVIVDCFV